MPIILLSSILSILNGNLEGINENVMTLINISVNALTAVMLVIMNQMKFESRSNHFKSVASSFRKLETEIEKHLISNDADDISQEFVMGVLTAYDTVIDNIQYDIPGSICNAVKNQYAGIKTLPLLINGVKKEDRYRHESVGGSIVFDGNI